MSEAAPADDLRTLRTGATPTLDTRLGGAVLEVDDSTADEEIDWCEVDDEQRATPGWPLDEEEAAWDLWYGGGEVA